LVVPPVWKLPAVVPVSYFATRVLSAPTMFAAFGLVLCSWLRTSTISLPTPTRRCTTTPMPSCWPGVGRPSDMTSPVQP
jgi:hypothetical protein